MEYAPTLFFNEFWLLRDHLIPLNETVDEVTLHFSLSGMSMWKWTIFTQMEQSFNMQVRSCLALRQLSTTQALLKLGLSGSASVVLRRWQSLIPDDCQTLTTTEVDPSKHR